MIFVNEHNADLMPALLRLKPRIQSQTNTARLKHMLKMLEIEGPTPIYDQMMARSERSKLLARRMEEAKQDASK